jgi:hypothetical protein
MSKEVKKSIVSFEKVKDVHNEMFAGGAEESDTPKETVEDLEGKNTSPHDLGIHCTKG